MRVHHFYPITRNIGDHFVQRGIEGMIRTLVPGAVFTPFNVNSRGEDKTGYGLTRDAVERANREADLIIVGGSNLYEGSYRWSWGVHLETDALKKLRAPLFLLGIGTGSDFLSRPHVPSPRARSEIALLNEHAAFSGARDVLTLDWLHRLGVSKATLTGDPATFIFNHPLRRGGGGGGGGGRILLAMPPVRFWSSKRQWWKVRRRGRAVFRAMAALALSLHGKGYEIVIACNDPTDWPLARKLFDGQLPGRVVCPQTTDEYFQLLSGARAVVSGRLHTAVAALSLGIPFVLVDADQRTRGFVDTYQLDDWSLVPSRGGVEARLEKLAGDLLGDDAAESWEVIIEKRERMYARAMGLLGDALRHVG